MKIDALNPVRYKIQHYLGACAVAVALGINIVSAQTTINLNSGAAGSLTGVPQSFNETRAVDVTVLSPVALLVQSMTLTGFSPQIQATSALIGARIYNTTTEALIASDNVTVSSLGPVTVSISATLIPGDEYRIGFFASTTPSNHGAGTLFLPNSFPYTDSSGLLQINGAYDVASDSFPTFVNLAEPQVTLQVVAVPEPGCMALAGLGLLTGFFYRRHFRARA